ncbi:MAG TPA: farnesyl diphosphate synthase [Sedimentisphaerales bacterium]|nr:farnesyl diphosphate synthase [Sedimentisphaerales bacterium]
MTQSLADSLRNLAEQVNSAMARMLEARSDIHPTLARAMKYALEGPGKRLRAAMALWSCQAVCREINDDALTCAVAIEMVHCYSLVHDDLPAMDDDDLRRGRPTCHIVFDEATAILTGDALLTLAFELLAKRIKDSGRAVRLVAELAEAAGPAGMIGGQMADIESENAEGNLQKLERIHADKTAKMFRAACRMGAIAGSADEKMLEAIGQYGFKTGLAFQVCDDILDMSRSSADLGKTAGKDAQQGKMTYPAVLGLEKSEEILNTLTRQAVNELDLFGEKADVLRTLAVALTERKK